MNYLLIYSKKDIAGINIKNNLVSYINELNSKDSKKDGIPKSKCKNGNENIICDKYEYKNDKLKNILKNIHFFETDKKLTDLFQKDIPREYDYYIFLSKHESKSKKPTLTVHTSGNLTDDTSHGGNAEEICPCDATLNSMLLRNICEYNNLDRYKRFNFEVSFEAIHHAPTDLNIPSVFVEIGSSEKEWKIREAGEIIAKSIIKTLYYLESIKNSKIEYDIDKNSNKYHEYSRLDRVIGFGGGHYAPRFTKLVISNKCYVGYIIPKHAQISENVLEQIISKQNFEYILFDWKGLKSEDKKRYIQFFEKNNIPWRRVKDLSTSKS